MKWGGGTSHQRMKSGGGTPHQRLGSDSDGGGPGSAAARASDPFACACTKRGCARVRPFCLRVHKTRLRARPCLPCSSSALSSCFDSYAAGEICSPSTPAP
eukprot:359668-Chlamydomonas_euryale.AAC.1